MNERRGLGRLTEGYSDEDWRYNGSVNCGKTGRKRVNRGTVRGTKGS